MRIDPGAFFVWENCLVRTVNQTGKGGWLVGVVISSKNVSLRSGDTVEVDGRDLVTIQEYSNKTGSELINPIKFLDKVDTTINEMRNNGHKCKYCNGTGISWIECDCGQGTIRERYLEEGK